MILFPPAKINLGLFITAKRPDGFHDLETCFYQVPWQDILEITPAESFSFSSSGLAISGSPASNLCFRAYEALQKIPECKPVHIHLHKVIPMGAGLGGGSSDAAYTLMGLRDVFHLPLTNADLIPYAQALGSDCAFFLTDQAQIGRGKGDELSPISVDLKGKYIVLIYPNMGITTQEAYAHVVPKTAPISLQEALVQPINTWQALVSNDFEASIFPTHPMLAEIKNELISLGADYAAMSGSGSTLFGIFEHEVDLPAAWSTYSTWKGFL